MNHLLNTCIRFLSFAALVLFIPAATAEQSDASVTDNSNLVQQAYALLESGQSEQAIKAFSQALQADATNLAARLGKAQALLNQQRHEEAFKAYDLVVQHSPAHIFAWNGRGLAAFNLKDFDEALNSFQRATADQPVNGFFYESLAWTYFCQGEYAQATTAAKQATLMYHQNSQPAAYPLLIAYFSQLEAGKPDEARRTLKYAQRNRPAEDAWPAPVFDYLDGRLSAAELISFVTDTAQETEAHSYIGLHLRSQGKLEQAQPHLSWVVSRGDKRVFEYTLARTLHTQDKVALLER